MKDIKKPICLLILILLIFSHTHIVLAWEGIGSGDITVKETPLLEVKVNHSYNESSKTLTFIVHVINKGDIDIRFQLGAGFSESVFDPTKGFPRPPYVGDISELGGSPSDYRNQILKPGEYREYIFQVDVRRLIERAYLSKSIYYLNKSIYFIVIVWEELGNRIYTYKFHEIKILDLSVSGIVLVQKALDAIDSILENLNSSTELITSEISELGGELLATLVSTLVSYFAPRDVAKYVMTELLSNALGVSVGDLFEEYLVKEKMIYVKKVHENLLPQILNAKRGVIDLYNESWNVNFLNDTFINDFITYLKFSKENLIKYSENIEKVINHSERAGILMEKFEIIVFVGSIAAVILTKGAALPIVTYVGLGGLTVKTGYLFNKEETLKALAEAHILNLVDGAFRTLVIANTLRYIVEGHKLPRIYVEEDKSCKLINLNCYVVKNEGENAVFLRITIINELYITPLSWHLTFISPKHVMINSLNYTYMLEPGEKYLLPIPQYDDETKEWIDQAHKYGYDVVNNVRYLIEYGIPGELVMGLKEVTSIIIHPRSLKPKIQYPGPGTYTRPIYEFPEMV